MTVAAATVWPKRAAIGLVLVALVAGLVVMIVRFVGSPEAPRRQIARIAILPDTPPPPPPPKEEPKKEPPKEEPKQAAPQEIQKPLDTPPPPANEPIKMEGAAGDGPSAFQSGSVSKEATGAPSTGPASPGGTGTASDRAKERFYATTAKQLLRDEIEKHLRPSTGETSATLLVWVEVDGRIGRLELAPGTEPGNEGELQLALDDTARALRLPPPAGVTQPMRFKLSLRAQG